MNIKLEISIFLHSVLFVLISVDNIFLLILKRVFKAYSILVLLPWNRLGSAIPVIMNDTLTKGWKLLLDVRDIKFLITYITVYKR
jgi:hypothetical protein